MSGWKNEAHLERLRALWDSGLSAARVATTLNREFADAAYTRSAVIGKVHRLHLPQRSVDAQRIAARIEIRRVAAMKAPRPPKPPPEPKPQRVFLKYAMTAPVAPILPSTLQPEAPTPAPVLEGPGLATVLTVRPFMCRWPIGEPQDADFTLCGRQKAGDGPYCAAHAARAYKPLPGGKKPSASELARSLRRYAA